MRAFREAVACGAHGVEFDVQRTRDEMLVVIHDERLDYSTTGRGWVRDWTWEELKSVQTRARSGDIIYGDAIPSLDEALGFLAGRDLVINIELKNGLEPYPGLEEQVLEAVAHHGIEANTIISSFNHASVRRVKEINPAVTTGIIYTGCLYGIWSYARTVKADALHVDRGFIDAAFVGAARDEGFMVNTFTVNDELEIQRVLEMGVDGIITNYPDRVARIIGSASPAR